MNVLTGAKFNTAVVSILGDRIIVTTAEIREPFTSAIYEFDRDFSLLRGRYSETYWEAQRRLELEGKLSHSRETCPDRYGPPAIHVWRD